MNDINDLIKLIASIDRLALRSYVTERLDSPGFEGRNAEFTVLSLKSVFNLT